LDYFKIFKGGKASNMGNIKNYFREMKDSLIEIDYSWDELYRKSNPYSYDALAFCLEVLDDMLSSSIC
jgi:hypothetical protein